MSMLGLAIGLMSWAYAGDAGQCGVVGLDKIDFSKVTAMAIRGVEADLEIVGADGFEVRQGGAVCTDSEQAPVEVKLVGKGTVVYLTVKASEADSPKLTVAVPKGLPALTIDHQTGSLTVDGLAANVAVVSSSGPVDVDGARSLRVAYVTGDVIANHVANDVTADHVTGNLKVDDIAGSLATTQVSGTVVHNNVRGQVKAL